MANRPSPLAPSPRSPRRGRSHPPFRGVRRASSSSDGGSVRRSSSIGGRSADRSPSGGGGDRRASSSSDGVRRASSSSDGVRRSSSSSDGDRRSSSSSDGDGRLSSSSDGDGRSSLSSDGDRRSSFSSDGDRRASSSSDGGDRRASDRGCMTPRRMAVVWEKNRVNRYALSRPFNLSKSLGGRYEYTTTKRLLGSSKTNSPMVFHTKKPLKISSLGAYSNSNPHSRPYWWTIPQYADKVNKGGRNFGPAVNILKFTNTFAFARLVTNLSDKGLELADKFEWVLHTIHQLVHLAIKSDIQFNKKWLDLIKEEIPQFLDIYAILGSKSSVDFFSDQWGGHGVMVGDNPLRFFRLGIKLFLQYSPGLQTALLANCIVVERGSEKYAAKLARECVFDLKKLLRVQVVLFARWWTSKKLRLLYELGICLDNNNNNVDCPREIQYQICKPTDLLILGPV